MKTLFLLGIVCDVLGLLCFLVPIPHTDSRTLRAGSVSVGVSRTETKHLPPAVGSILIVAGLGLMIAGSRK
jgi:hypothetical protein